jgi:PPOX class probable F420-dependent enzyme
MERAGKDRIHATAEGPVHQGRRNDRADDGAQVGESEGRWIGRTHDPVLHQSRRQEPVGDAQARAREGQEASPAEEEDGFGEPSTTETPAAASERMTSGSSLQSLRREKTVLLTTHRRGGAAVSTPVSIAFEGERAFFRTWDTAGKAKRLRNDPEVEIAPSTFGGKRKGPSILARARLLDGEAEVLARKALARSHPVLHGIVVPLVHRLRGDRTIHFELLPARSTIHPTGTMPAR